MFRPCHKEHPEPVPSECHNCFLFETSPAHNKLWGGSGVTTVNKVYNFAKALAKHVASGFSNVDDKTYDERLKVCSQCDQNKDGECQMCGCILSIKARWATEDCPAHKWPTLPVINAAKGGCGCGVSNNR